MARKVKDKALDSREQRLKQRPRGKPYYRALEEGLHLGYRRLKSGAGKWVVRFYDGNQAYIVETIALADDLSDANDVSVLSFDQAQRKAREQRDQRHRAAAGKHAPLTVRDAIEAYLDYLDNHKKTGADSRWRANVHIMPQLGGEVVEKLTPERIRKWLNGLAKTPARTRTKPGEQQRLRAAPVDPDTVRARRATANRVLTVLKAALNMAWHDGRVASDTAWRRVAPFPNTTSARQRYLTVDEARRLVNACEPDLRSLVQCALATGARFGELAALAVADFDKRNGTVAIRQSKSGKARHVVLTEEGVAIFSALCAGRAGDEPLLLKSSGTAWIATQQCPPFNQAIVRGKITPKATFHACRHTYASLAIMNGTPLMVVAKNLGHRDTRMVEAHYGHLCPSYAADAIRAGAPRFGFEPDTNVAVLVR